MADHEISTAALPPLRQRLKAMLLGGLVVLVTVVVAVNYGEYKRKNEKDKAEGNKAPAVQTSSQHVAKP